VKKSLFTPEVTGENAYSTPQINLRAQQPRADGHDGEREKQQVVVPKHKGSQ
jgi:hypothetical protein